MRPQFESSGSSSDSGWMTEVHHPVMHWTPLKPASWSPLSIKVLYSIKVTSSPSQSGCGEHLIMGCPWQLRLWISHRMWFWRINVVRVFVQICADTFWIRISLSSPVSLTLNCKRGKTSTIFHSLKQSTFLVFREINMHLELINAFITHINQLSQNHKLSHTCQVHLDRFPCTYNDCRAFKIIHW